MKNEERFKNKNRKKGKKMKDMKDMKNIYKVMHKLANSGDKEAVLALAKAVTEGKTDIVQLKDLVKLLEEIAASTNDGEADFLLSQLLSIIALQKVDAIAVRQELDSATDYLKNAIDKRYPQALSLYFQTLTLDLLSGNVDIDYFSEQIKGGKYLFSTLSQLHAYVLPIMLTWDLASQCTSKLESLLNANEELRQKQALLDFKETTLTKTKHNLKIAKAEINSLEITNSLHSIQTVADFKKSLQKQYEEKFHQLTKKEKQLCSREAKLDETINKERKDKESAQQYARNVERELRHLRKFKNKHEKGNRKHFEANAA